MIPAALRRLDPRPIAANPGAVQNDIPHGLTDGVALTVWGSDGLRTAVASAAPLLADAKPDVVQLHAGPTGLAKHLEAQADEVRRFAPDAGLWVGVAWDGWVSNAAKPGADVPRLVERVYVPAAKAAFRAGASLFVVNSEAAGKLHPRAARTLTVLAIDRIREECPGMLLAVTSYDHPDYHDEETGNGRIDADDEGYPWSAGHGGPVARAVGGLLLPKSGRVELALPQRYAAPAKDPVTKRQPRAGLGALDKRVASSHSSWARAVALGWIDPALPVRDYVQGHHVDPRDTVKHLVVNDLVAVWAAPTRLDAEGAAAIRVALRVRRGLATAADLRGPDAALYTAALQAIVGAKHDGSWGPLTSAAAARWILDRGYSGGGDAASVLAILGRISA